MEARTIAATAMMLMLTGCGGEPTLGTTTPPNSASPGGIWNGTESVSGLQILGMVDESGNFNFIRGDRVQYTGTAKVSGNALTANIEGIVPLGFTFTDGSAHGTGTISGTVQARASLHANTQFTTDANNTSSGTIDLTFNAVYNRPSSLTTLSGNFIDTSNQSVVTIGTNGAVFSQDAASGCVLNGTASLIDAKYNLYKIQFDYGNCAGPTLALNGVPFSGLATLDNTVAPERLYVGATGQSGNVKYSVVLVLDRG